MYEIKLKKPVSDIRLFPTEQENNKRRVLSDDRDYDGLNADELLKRLNQRLTEMDSARLDVGRWQEYLDQYYSFVDNGRTNLPIEMATIRNKLADVETQRTVTRLIPTEREDVAKKDILTEILAYVDAEADTEEEKSRARLYSMIFGTAIWFEGIKTQIRTQYIPNVDDEGKIDGEKKTVTNSWLYGGPIDIRDFWGDPVARVEDMRDCFIQQRDVTYDYIEGLIQDPNYIKENVQAYLDTLNPQDTRSPLHDPFMLEQDSSEARRGRYTLLNYYNCEKGIYIVVDAEFRAILRYGVIPYPHGQLPISILVDHKRYESVYGIGECEILRSTKYERNVIRTQIVDTAQESNTLNLAVGEGITFQQSRMVQGAMRIWNFAGDLNQAQFLKAPGQDSSLFNVDSLLKDDATWITGIDNNALMGNPTKTAYEARLQEYNKLKGVGQYIQGFDYFWTRVVRQRLANIQFFLPYTTGKRILGDSKGEKLKTIPLENKEIEGMNTVVDTTGTTPRVKDIAPKIKSSPGKTAFLRIDANQLRNSMDVQVETVSTTPILRELMSQELDLFVNQMVQLSQAIPSIGEKLAKFNVENWIDMKMRALAINTDDLFESTEDVSEEGILGEFMAQFPTPYQPAEGNVPTSMGMETGSRPIPRELIDSMRAVDDIEEAPLVSEEPAFLQQEGAQVRER